VGRGADGGPARRVAELTALRGHLEALLVTDYAAIGSLDGPQFKPPHGLPPVGGGGGGGGHTRRIE
jgi:hypothetical protein